MHMIGRMQPCDLPHATACSQGKQRQLSEAEYARLRKLVAEADAQRLQAEEAQRRAEERAVRIRSGRTHGSPPPL